jgi:molybdate transport system substrate-binding protein
MLIQFSLRTSRPIMVIAVISAIALLVMSAPAQAASAQVAVAANFAAPMKPVVVAFEKLTGHNIAWSAGSTAKFYAQIKNGAPFDVFLSADVATPARLEQEGNAVPGSRFTYAAGRLALWSATPGFVDAAGAVLKSGRFKHIALASPQLAPYGAAAVEVMTRLDVFNTLQSKFVMGENIAQTYNFVATGNAELGFVAQSQVMENGQLASGSGWLVPSNLHAPILQDAVLLARGKSNPAALAFLQFLKSDTALVILKTHGYEVAR